MYFKCRTNEKNLRYERFSTRVHPRKIDRQELTFMESGYEKTFMFAQSNTFIQLDGSGIKPFQLRWVILALLERIILKRENEISICQEKMNTFTSNVFFRFNIENERIQNSIVVKARIKFEIKKKKEKISNFTSEKG